MSFIHDGLDRCHVLCQTRGHHFIHLTRTSLFPICVRVLLPQPAVYSVSCHVTWLSRAKCWVHVLSLLQKK